MRKTLSLFTISFPLLLAACSPSTQSVLVSPTELLPTATSIPPTNTPAPTASETPTLTPTPTLTYTPTPTATPTLPEANSAPEEFAVQKVTEIEGEVYGLNELGWATAKYEDGGWVSYERPIYIVSWSKAITEDIPQELLVELTPAEVHRIQVADRTTDEVVFGEAYHWPQLELEGTISADENGNLDYGLVWVARVAGENRDLEDLPHHAFLSGLILGVYDSDAIDLNVRYVLLEIPGLLKRQIISIAWPNQRTGFRNGLAMPPGRALVDLHTSTYRGIGMNWDQWLDVLSQGRGEQVIIAVQEVRDADGIEGGKQAFDEFVNALDSVEYFNRADRKWMLSPSFGIIPEELIQ